MKKENSVEIPNIEQELKALAEKDKEQNRVRACLFNLILYTHEGHRKTYLKGMISLIIQNFPCRIIFIQNEKDSKEDTLKVSVSSEIYDQGETCIACDQITIKVSGDHLDRVSYLIPSLVVTDLPIYVFWGQDPTFENRILAYLQNFAAKIIFDTDNIVDLHKFSKKILDTVKNSKIEVVDIQWTLLSSWRNVFSEVFDNSERIKQLRNAKEISISINRLKDSSDLFCKIQSLYLQAWLGSRMEWNFKSIKRSIDFTEISYCTPNGIVSFHLTYGNKKELLCGSIIGIEVQGESHFHVSMIRQLAAKNVVIHITEENTCLLPYTLPFSDNIDGFNFMKQVFYGISSSHYEEMLQQLIKI